MKNFVLASRYARALYNYAREHQVQDAVFDQMRAFEEAVNTDAEIREFFLSPLVRPADKVAYFEQVATKIKFAEPLKNFLLVLAKKNRLAIFADIVAAYQTISDEAHGVSRGVVHSAAVLGPEERARIQDLVSQATRKQVILTYKEDPSLLGGLVAEVGSFTFDDSLKSHLNRMNELLTRSSH